MTRPAPAAACVDLCLHAFDPDAAGAADAWQLRDTVLGAEERGRLHAFVHARDRQAYLRSRLLLRRVLGERAGVAPESLVFRRLPGGKPAIDLPSSARSLAFNLSHTDGLVACAVSTDRHVDVGVDAEREHARVDALMRSSRVLSPREMQALQGLPDEQARRQRLFLLWTLKEACVKASGQGLTLDLSRLCLQLTDRQVRLRQAHGLRGGGHWSFFHHQPTTVHRLALAVRTAVPKPLAIRLSWLRDEDFEPLQGEAHGQANRRQPPRHHSGRG